MPERQDERSRGRWKPEQIPGERRPDDAAEERNFETQVSEINTDPDAGFDFDMNPTDEKETPHSER